MKRGVWGFRRFQCALELLQLIVDEQGPLFSSPRRALFRMNQHKVYWSYSMREVQHRYVPHCTFRDRISWQTHRGSLWYSIATCQAGMPCLKLLNHHLLVPVSVLYSRNFLCHQWSTLRWREVLLETARPRLLVGPTTCLEKTLYCFSLLEQMLLRKGCHVSMPIAQVFHHLLFFHLTMILLYYDERQWWANSWYAVCCAQWFFLSLDLIFRRY